jgi:hypothetical protein
MHRARMTMPDRFLQRAGLVDGVQWQSNFDKFFLHVFSFLLLGEISAPEMDSP